MRPMETPAFEKSFKGATVWFLWKIGFGIYVLSSALPMIGYIASLFVIAIKRETSILIAIVMMVMLHPLVTLVFGIFAKTMGQILLKKLPSAFKYKTLSRLFTYSINGHFTSIAGLTLYFYEMKITLGKAKALDFSDNSYAQCTCDILSEFGQACENRETDYSFQNLFLTVPLQTLLLVFLITSISCHLIQSFIIYLPAPIQLLHFILQKDQAQNKSFTKENKSFSKEITGSSLEMENLNKHSEDAITKPNVQKNSTTIWIKVLCCVTAILFFVGLICIPWYGLDVISKGSGTGNNGKHELTLPCKYTHINSYLH